MGISQINEVYASLDDFASIFQYNNDSNGSEHLGTHIFWISKLHFIPDPSIYDCLLQNGSEQLACSKHLLLDGILHYLLHDCHFPLAFCFPLSANKQCGDYFKIEHSTRKQ